MNKLFFTVLLMLSFWSYESRSQRYKVEITIDDVACNCTTFSWQNFRGSVSYSGQTRSFTNITSTPYTALNYTFNTKPTGNLYIDVSPFYGFNECSNCSLSKTETISFTPTSANGCISNDHYVYAGSGTTSSGMYYTVKWTPIDFAIDGPSVPTPICESDNINLTTTSNYGNGNYTWKYQVEGQSTFSTFNSPKTNYTTGNINMTDIFGSNHSSYFGENIYFQAGIGNCTDLSVAYIFYPDKPIPTSHTVSGVFCKGDTNWSINITGTSRIPISGETFRYALYQSQTLGGFLFDTSSATLNSSSVGGLAADKTYYVVIESFINSTATGCGSLFYYPVYVDEPTTALTISTSKTDESCQSSNNGSITVGQSGGWGGYTFSKNSTTTYQTSNVFSGLVAGNYVMRVKDSGGCVVASPTVTIDQPAAELNINTPVFINETCQSANDGKITINATGGWGGKTYSKNSSTVYQSSNVFTGLSAGTYTMRVKDSGGCVKASSIITIDQAASELSIGTPSKTNETCRSGNNGTITINASGGYGGYTYSKNSITTYQTSNVFSSLIAGNYTLRVKDSGGCIKSASITIDQSATELSIGIPDKTNTCLGTNDGTISIFPAGGWGSYTYSKNSTVTYQNSNVFTGLAAGNYTMRVMDNGGCIKSTNVIIDEPLTNVTFTTVEIDVLCKGTSSGTITISPSGGWGGYTYSVNSTINYQTSNLFAVMAGTHTIRVKDSEGCIAQSNVTINEPTNSLIFNYVANQITCQGDDNGSITITDIGGWGGTTYSIDNGINYQADNVFSNLSAGLYKLKVKDSGNCETGRQDVVVSEPNEILAISFNSTKVICKEASNGTITLSGAGGWGGYDYSIDNGLSFQSSGNFVGLIPDTYLVKARDSEGCETMSQSIIISEPAIELSFSIDQLNVSCKNTGDGNITIIANGGWGVYEYSNDGGITYQSANNFASLVPATYYIRVKDLEGCETLSQNATITEPELMETWINNEVKATCGETNGSAESNTVGGTLPYAYSWRNLADQVVSTTATLSNVTGGIYTLLVTDANGCTNTSEAIISSNNGPLITIEGTTVTTCYNSTDGTATISVSVVDGGYSVLWADGQQTTTATNLPKGDIIVTVADDDGCLAIERIFIPGPEPISLQEVILIPPACNGDSNASLSVTVTGGNGGYSYQWDNGSSEATAGNLSAGAYQVTVKDSKGCEWIETFMINDPQPVGYSITTLNSPTCAGGEDGRISVTGTGGTGVYTLNWDDGTSGNEINSVSSGTYGLTIEDSNQCIISDEIILEPTLPIVFDIADKEICIGQQYIQQAGIEAVTYEWSGVGDFLATTSEVLISESGTYHLYIINSDGCEVEDSFIVSSSDDLLNADFLMFSEAYVGDTVVMIDISWPIPDQLIWTFESGVTVLTENSDYAEVVFNDPGTYNVEIETALADCEDFNIQSISILDRGQKPNVGGRQAVEELAIQKFTVNPNPNDGAFEIEIELNLVANIHLKMVDLQGNQIMLTVDHQDQMEYLIPVNIPNIQSGIYILWLRVGMESKALRLFVK